MARSNGRGMSSDRRVDDARRANVEFRRIRFAVESIAAGHDVPRHRHLDAYATLIIEGAYEQTAYAGRLRVAAGDVLVQPTLDCHANRMLSRGVRLLRLPWPRDCGLGGVFRIVGIDEILRTGRIDVVAASAMLIIAVRRAAPLAPLVDCVGDLLAADLAADPELHIGHWAERTGIAREHATRSFTRTFAVSPARFGAELKARAAWLRAVESRERLCDVAACTGFCDQAHMTREVKRLTGDTPANWRRLLDRPSDRASAAIARTG